MGTQHLNPTSDPPSDSTGLVWIPRRQSQRALDPPFNLEQTNHLTAAKKIVTFGRRVRPNRRAELMKLQLISAYESRHATTACPKTKHGVNGCSVFAVKKTFLKLKVPNLST